MIHDKTKRGRPVTGEAVEPEASFEAQESFFTLFSAASGAKDRPRRVLVFADIVESTAMKQSGTEVSWLPTVGFFLDYLTESVKDAGGDIVKYLGDGVMAVFDDDHAHDAINAAVAAQEKLQKANHDRRISCNCSIGIATGPVVEYSGPGGISDYIGSTVDLAARLCGAANAGAIFVDVKTVEAANMGKVHSQFGLHTPNGHDYLSPEQKAPLKGFNQAQPYREIVWAQQPFGVRGAAVTDYVAREAPHGGAGIVATPTTPTQTPTAKVDVKVGVVRHWSTDKGNGFITSSDGDYYTNKFFLADGDELRIGDRVAFVPQEPSKAGVRPKAGCVVATGIRLSVSIARINMAKRLAVADLRDRNGIELPLFMFPGEKLEELSNGKQVDVLTEVTDRGVKGRLLEPDEDVVSR